MPKILIADDVGEECISILRKADLDVDAKGKMKPDELKAAIPAYDGLIVRSAAKVTKEVIEAGTRLKIVGRAGVGTDNIDREAATRRGVIVMNTPLGNVVSAAEHTFAILLANARNVAPAEASMRAGKWERSIYEGVELDGKTLGIVGLGKVGTLMTRYARGFGMRVIAYDPLVVKEKAEEAGVELVEFERILAESDFITVHVPLSDKTRGMFGAAQFKKMKKTARIVNTSRGGVVDEAALHEALSAGDIAGAALDVYSSEPPPKDLPLVKLPNITLTPHLGASTEEAQVKVAVHIAEQFVDYFKTGMVRNAVNLAGLADPALAPYMRLAEDLGGLAAQLTDGRVKKVSVSFLGRLGGYNVAAITQSAVAGALRPTLGDGVNVINSRLVARDAGIEVTEEKRKEARGYQSLLAVKVDAEKGTKAVAGTVFEGRDPRIVLIDDVDIDLRPARNILCLYYTDMPGVVGKIGTTLGRNAINIARMEVGRTERGRKAMVILTLDDPVPPSVVEEIRQAVQPHEIHAVTLI